ncbi:unnamed protein product [Adineta steineri]|uniref:Apple domain-containing protein n=1 Tax=Adineta steineri TaxID=433720 RepID=A0A818X813_9BILA|nr:unnamed protein product [Adineta steineri]
MFATMRIIFLASHIILSTTTPVTVYNNAYFNPINTNYLLSNLSSITSVNDCLCQCYDNAICFTANYFYTTHRCILFFAQLNQGQLQVAPATVNASVYSFGNSNNTTVAFFNRTNETVYNIWNTTAGGSSVYAVSGYSVGSYWPAGSGQTAFDGDLTTALCSYGTCDFTGSSQSCGEKTGFYLTMNGGSKILAGFQMSSSSVTWSRVRDPMVITIEGSNLNGSALTLGSSWALIYNGSAGFITDPGRAASGILQSISNPSIAFASYRLLVTLKEGGDSCPSFSELQFVML